jgi:transcriptional regulator with XRE-family HTH domain
MKEARLQAAVRERRPLSQAAMAELVSEQLGRIIHQTQWSNYELAVSEPPFDVVAAAAQLSGLTEAYIAFGVSADLQVDPTQDRKLTEAGPESDRARAARQAEATKEARRKASDKGSRKRGA